jgi:hypothetical protein
LPIGVGLLFLLLLFLLLRLLWLSSQKAWYVPAVGYTFSLSLLLLLLSSLFFLFLSSFLLKAGLFSGSLEDWVWVLKAPQWALVVHEGPLTSSLLACHIRIRVQMVSSPLAISRLEV